MNPFIQQSDIVFTFSDIGMAPLSLVLFCSKFFKTWSCQGSVHEEMRSIVAKELYLKKNHSSKQSICFKSQALRDRSQKCCQEDPVSLAAILILYTTVLDQEEILIFL